MSDYASKISSLTSKEVARCADDPDAMSEIIEKLATYLAFTIAVACKGDAEAINTMLEGVSAHLYETATDRAPLAAMIASAKMVQS